MGRRNTLLLVSGLAAVLVLLYSLVNRAPEQSVPVEAAADIDERREEPKPTKAATSQETIESVPLASTRGRPEQVPVDAPEDCLTEAQLAGHPMLNDELRRAEAISISGPQIAAYRGLPAETVENFAAQGDSAAMAVLGAVSMMRAKGFSEDDAIAYLETDLDMLRLYLRAAPAEDALIHYEEAYRWFYEAAVHGRLMALQYAGDALGYARGHAVGLEWISKEDFDTLNMLERSALIPQNVFTRAMYEIAPELRTGLTDFYELLPRSDAQAEIAKDLAGQFKRDRQSAQLPPIDIKASTAPPLDELKAMLCERRDPD